MSNSKRSSPPAPVPTQQTMRSSSSRVLADMDTMRSNSHDNISVKSMSPSSSSSFRLLSNAAATATGSKSSSCSSFSSNMSAVLNDPRKERTRVANLFTKTWGSDFVESPNLPPVNGVNFRNYRLKDFQEHLASIKQRQLEHSRNKLDALSLPGDERSKQSSNKLELSLSLQKQKSDLEKIPKIFFDANFCLTNKETFNAILSSASSATSSPASRSTARDSAAPKSSSNPFLVDDEADEATVSIVAAGGTEHAETYKKALDRLSVYLDITESHISKQISTKANTFFNAIHSQDEVQEHVLKTCTAVKQLRANLRLLDESVIMRSIRVIKLVNKRLRLLALIDKLERMSSVYETQPAIQVHLNSSEFTGALDLIAMSQVILRQELRGIRALRHYDSQFSEMESLIDKILHQEFAKYIISDLSRDFLLGSGVLNSEKLYSMMLGILRIKTSNFVDLCKEEILMYLKTTVKQTVVEFISQLDDDDDDEDEAIRGGNNQHDESNIKLADRVRLLKVPDFLLLVSKVSANLRTMLTRAQSMVAVIQSVVDAAAGVVRLSKLSIGQDNDEDNTHLDEDEDESQRQQQQQKQNHLRTVDKRQSSITSSAFVDGKELISRQAHTKLSAAIRNLVADTSHYAQERLVNMLEGKFSRENGPNSSSSSGIEKLSVSDFISLSSLIDQFVVEFDLIANKKTSSLRSWLQNQSNKFFNKFHNEKKEKLTLALESEKWKQNEVQGDFQAIVDHIFRNGFGVPLPGKKSASSTVSIQNSVTPAKDTSTSNINDYLLVNGEKYIVFSTVIVLVKLVYDYCQFCTDMSHLSFDIMNRLVELLKHFNVKTYQMILGAAAVEKRTLKIITFKTLALTYRCLEAVLEFVPLVRDFFRQKLAAGAASENRLAASEKQFAQIAKDLGDHKAELNNKLLSMIDDIFRELLATYQVIAPVPSQCFRSTCQQIAKVHEITQQLFNQAKLIALFTDIHVKFKSRLAQRLRELGVLNDGGPQHALIFSDMIYYIKQFKALNGLHTVTINFEDVWTS